MDLREHALSVGALAVCRAANVHKDGVAAIGRRANSVVGRNCVFPGSAVGRLRLCPSGPTSPPPRDWRASPSRRAGCRRVDIADRRRAGL